MYVQYTQYCMTAHYIQQCMYNQHSRQLPYVRTYTLCVCLCTIQRPPRRYCSIWLLAVDTLEPLMLSRTGYWSQHLCWRYVRMCLLHLSSKYTFHGLYNDLTDVVTYVVCCGLPGSLRASTTVHGQYVPAPHPQPRPCHVLCVSHFWHFCDSSLFPNLLYCGVLYVLISVDVYVHTYVRMCTLHGCTNCI